jgi:hypothetical protein
MGPGLFDTGRWNGRDGPVLLLLAYENAQRSVYHAFDAAAV